MNSNGQWLWWCGHWDQTDWCTAGKNASLVTYPRGDIASIEGVTNIKTTNISHNQNNQSCPSTINQPPQSDDNDDSCVPPQALNSAKLGIGLGIGLPFLLAITGLTVMLFRERRRTKDLRTLAQQPQYILDEKDCLTHGGQVPGELITTHVYELGEGGRTPELDVRRATLKTEPTRKGLTSNYPLLL
jgi:hypothetical protein